MAEGDAAAEEALAAADALGLDSAWSDTAVSQVRSRPDADPADGAAPAGRGAACGPAGPATSTSRCGSCSTRRPSPSRPAGSSESLELDAAGHRAGRATSASSGRSTRPSCGTCRSPRCTWPGDWDASLAEADLLARVPEMAAHVRAAGLLVQVGRGDPAARERLAWARALIPRLHEHVLLGLVTAAVGDRPRRLGRRRRRRPSRSRSTASPPAAGAVGGRPPRRRCAWSATALRAGGRCRGRGPAGRRHRRRSTRWVGAGEALAELARSAVDVYAGGVRRRWASRRRPGCARVEAEAARLHGRAGAGAVAGRGRGVRLRARLRGGPVAVAAGRGAAGRR